VQKMARQGFGAKPSVLRCSRCGKFVDWEQARLQIVCGCRSQLELPPVLVRTATEHDRPRIQELLLQDFGHLTIVAFGEVMHADQEAALVAEMRDDIAGALAWRRMGDAIHLVALVTDPMWQRSGVGGYLLAEAELLARREGLSRLVTATSNDNLPSLYFFQRHGYRMTAIVADAFAQHLKDQHGAGFAGIAVRDEVQLEKILA
jgi:N-acetylglutamate synthase-like GNAT family acetyltransferase